MPAVLLTPVQLAERWGMKPTGLALQRHRRQGPPFIRLSNGTVRYRLSDIVRFERERRTDPLAIAGAR